MKRQWVTSAFLVFAFLLSVGASFAFLHLHSSSSRERVNNCTSAAIATGHDQRYCTEADSAASMAYSSLMQLINIVGFLGIFSAVIVAERLFSTEREIDKLRRRIDELERDRNA
jgi:hypothetical protein